MTPTITLLKMSFFVIKKNTPFSAETADKKNTGTYRILHRLDPGFF
jgi:hypothetical protein